MEKEIFEQNDYANLDERQKLRFIIASFKKCKRYYNCDIKCAIILIEDDERIDKALEFAKKYNLLPEDVAILINIFLRQEARKYLRTYSGKIFIELKEIVEL